MPRRRRSKIEIAEAVAREYKLSPTQQLIDGWVWDVFLDANTGEFYSAPVGRLEDLQQEEAS